jgi:ABC-type nitrate/sulfonate/bicarbonate transport system ATPase subunit
VKIEKDKEDEGAERPFELKNLKLVIPQGTFVAIIGRVGCGKVWINLVAIRRYGC